MTIVQKFKIKSVFIFSESFVLNKPGHKQRDSCQHLNSQSMLTVYPIRVLNFVFQDRQRWLTWCCNEGAKIPWWTKQRNLSLFSFYVIMICHVVKEKIFVFGIGSQSRRPEEDRDGSVGSNRLVFVLIFQQWTVFSKKPDAGAGMLSFDNPAWAEESSPCI